MKVVFKGGRLIFHNFIHMKSSTFEDPYKSVSEQHRSGSEKVWVCTCARSCLSWAVGKISQSFTARSATEPWKMARDL